jgi:hypothetical protein
MCEIKQKTVRKLSQVNHQCGYGAAQCADDRSRENENEDVIAQGFAKADAEKICDSDRPSQYSEPTLGGRD